MTTCSPAWRVFALALALGVPISSLAAAPIVPTTTNVTNASLPELTTARQVRQLSPEEALRGYPVHLRATVIYYRQDIFHELTIQDETAGIYVTNTTVKRLVLAAGDVVDVTGRSGPGSFAPVIILSNLTVLGRAPLPAPRELPYERLASGAEDCQWVQVRGIVHNAVSLRTDGGNLSQLELAVSGGRLTARLPRMAPEALRALIDSEVVLQGVCMTSFNYRRQMFGVRLSVPTLDQLHLEKPAPDLASAPTRTINSLHRFEPGADIGHRVKVQGTVLFQDAGQSLFIRDDTQALWVKSRQTNAIAVGARVEAIGFPASGEFSPTLQDATFRQLGKGDLPRPIKLRAEQALKAGNDCDLVQLEGVLRDWSRTPSEDVLVIQDHAHTFQAHFEHTNGAAFNPPPLRSRVRVTGICLVQLGNQRWPQSFRIVLREPTDVLLLQPPGWWTLGRVLWALGGTSVLCIAALAWVVTLKRQVRAQTRIIQQKFEREAVLEERTRIAREFHDTLEQQLSAAVLQLQAARSRLDTSPEFTRRVLQLVESMLRHTQSEARHSVWDLRARALENGTLGSALSTTTSFVRDGSPVEARVKVTGQPRPLPGRIENHLLRIGQEATANAVRHAAAHNIAIELLYETRSVRLSIEDDGRGFEVDSVAAGVTGHFGLLGMRERAEKIGGQFGVSSAPGRGTRIEVMVPVQDGADTSHNLEMNDEEKDKHPHC